MANKKFDFESDAAVLKMLKKQLNASHDLIEYISALRDAYMALKEEKSKECSGPDTQEMAQQLMNIPLMDIHSQKVSSKCEECTDCKDSHKIVSEDPVIEEGQFGDIWDITRVQNASETQFGFDFYHHCPKVQDNLVRLDYSKSKDKHQCRYCSQVFLSKYPTGSVSE